MLLIADRKDVSYLTFIHLLHLLLWLKILTREKKRDSWIEFRWPCQAFFPSGFCSGRQFSHISDVCLLVLVVYIHAFSAVECLFGNLLITSTGFGWSCRWSARKAAAPTKAFFIDHRTLTHTHTQTHTQSQLINCKNWCTSANFLVFLKTLFVLILHWSKIVP